MISIKKLSLIITLILFQVTITKPCKKILSLNQQKPSKFSIPLMSIQSISLLNTTKYITNTGAIITISIGINSLLDYISTFMHEHGHGIASNGNYSIEIFPWNSEFPLLWGGVTHYYNQNNPFIRTLAGPLAGILTTYLQCIILKTLKGYFNNKPLRTSFYKGIVFPISSFKKRIKIGKNIALTLLNNLSISHKNQTFKTISLNTVLFLRMSRIIGETVYGLLPYSTCTLRADEMIKGDGEIIWKKLFGPQCPTFKGKLIYIAITIILIPYIIGAIQAIYEKTQHSSDLHTNDQLDQIILNI